MAGRFAAKVTGESSTAPARRHASRSRSAARLGMRVARPAGSSRKRAGVHFPKAIRGGHHGRVLSIDKGPAICHGSCMGD
jgi:hypothetical protein